MTSRKKIFFLFFFILLVFFLSFGVWFYHKNRKASLLIESDPVAQVYINGEQVGRTPFEREFAAREVAVRLVPEALDKPLMAYDTKIELVRGVKTIVRRKLGESVEDSSGEEISFEKTGGKNANVSVISRPDGAQVYFDDRIVDLTPLLIEDVSEGVHEIRLFLDGYFERAFSVNAYSGYTLTALVDLEKDENAQSDVLEEINNSWPSSPLEVEILNTPTGFLRVREEPSTSSEEVGRVDPGEKYELLDRDSVAGWYKIKFDEGIEGWISSEYATESAEIADD